MAKKGQLKNAISTRRKHKRITGGRHKGGRGGGVVKAGDEFKKDAAAKKKGAFDDMDAEEFLQGGFEDDLSDEEAGSGSGDESDLDLSEDDADMVEGDDDDEDAELPSGDGAAEEGDEEEEEGGEEGAADPVLQDNKRLKGEISKHKAQLEALREKDPEFYKYLQDADAELLGFGSGSEDEGDEDDEEDEDEDEDEEDEGAGKKAKKAEAKDKKKAKEAAEEEEAGGADEEDDGKAGPSGRIELTSALLARWTAAARGEAPYGAGGKGRPPALGSFGFLVRAYRLAAHYGDPSEDVDSGKLRITSSSVYNAVTLFMLREADGIFRRLLGLAVAAEGGAEGGEAPRVDAAKLAKNPRWRKVGPLLKSFWGNSLTLLGAITDPPLLAFTLRRLRASVGFLAPFARLRDRFLRACLTVFGGGEVAPRLQAFLAIRAMAVALPQPALDNCLKGVYRSFVSNAKFVSAASAPHIAFMSACVVELWGLDMEASYQHAFTAVRQLAALLRTALTSKAADAYKQVYCWQTVNCLELWAKVLSAHADRSELRPLVYPVAQLLLGAARLVPTPRYFPLRLRLARALNRMSSACGVFVPVAPLALEALAWSDLRRPPGGGGGGGGKGKGGLGGEGAADLSLQLRLGKAALRSGATQEEVVTQVLEVLADHLAAWSCSVAFPELAHLPLLQLRKFAKACPVERFRRSAKLLADAVARNATWVGAARDRVDFGPKDGAKVQAFLRDEREAGRAPLQQYAAALAAKAAQRAAARRADEVGLCGGERGRKRGRGGDSDSEGDEEGDEEEGGSEEDGGEADSEEEEEEQTRGGKKAAAKRRREAAAEAAWGGGEEEGDGEGDVLADYVPSDDDEADDVVEGEAGSSEDGDDESGDEEGGAPLGGMSSDEGDDGEEGGRGGAAVVAAAAAGAVAGVAAGGRAAAAVAAGAAAAGEVVGPGGPRRAVRS